MDKTEYQYTPETTYDHFPSYFPIPDSSPISAGQEWVKKKRDTGYST